MVVFSGVKVSAAGRERTLDLVLHCELRLASFRRKINKIRGSHSSCADESGISSGAEAGFAAVFQRVFCPVPAARTADPAEHARLSWPFW